MIELTNKERAILNIFAEFQIGADEYLPWQSLNLKVAKLAPPVSRAVKDVLISLAVKGLIYEKPKFDGGPFLSQLGEDTLYIEGEETKLTYERGVSSSMPPGDEFLAWIGSVTYPKTTIGVELSYVAPKPMSLSIIKQFLGNREFQPLWHYLFELPPHFRIDDYLHAESKSMSVNVGDYAFARFFQNGAIWYKFDLNQESRTDSRIFEIGVSNQILACALLLGNAWAGLIGNSDARVRLVLRGTEDTVAQLGGRGFAKSHTGIQRSMGKICKEPGIEVETELDESPRQSFRRIWDDLSLHFRVADSTNEVVEEIDKKIFSTFEKSLSPISLSMPNESKRNVAAPESGAKDAHEKRDVFLCHASEDKIEIVRPFLQALEARSISYWYDEAEIGWGDSIVKKVNEGLSKSRYVIVFISDAFLGKGWPKTEMESALSKEIATGQVVVLPILIALPDKVFTVYPMLSSKLYKVWDSGNLEALVGELKALISKAGVK